MPAFTCPCDNVLSVSADMSGQTIECPKCGDPFRVPMAIAPRPIPKKAPEPEPPRVRRPAPRIRRPAPTSSRGGWVIGALFAVVSVVVVVVVLSGGKKPAPVVKTEAADPPVAKAEKKIVKKEAPATEEPRMLSREYRSKLDLLGWRRNLTGIAAAFLDYRAKHTSSSIDRRTANDFRYEMSRLESEQNRFVDFLRQRGHNPFIEEAILSTDRITHFGNQELADLPDYESLKLLGTFLREMKAGSRVRVAVRRSGRTTEMNIVFDQRPKELLTIIQVADVIPGKQRTTVEKPVVREPFPVKDTSMPGDERAKDAFDTLVTLKLRSVRSNRQAARKWFEKSADTSDYSLAAVRFLSQSEEPELLQEYFEKHAGNGADGFSAEEHVRAVRSLADLIDKAKSGREWLTLFARGHLGDLVADGGAKPVGEAMDAMGYVFSDNRGVIGTRSEVAVYDLARCGADFRKGAARAAGGAVGYPNKFVKMYYTVGHAVETGNDIPAAYGMVKSLARSGSSRDRRDVAAIGEGLLRLAKCTECVRGSNKCAACNGKGKRTVVCPKCKGKKKIPYPKSDNMFRWCDVCGALGERKGQQCPDCKGQRSIRCEHCDLKGWKREMASGSVSDVFSESDCATCDGRGIRMKHVAELCTDCHGLGRKLTPTFNSK